MTLSSDSSALSDTNSCASPAFRTSGNRRNLGGEPIAERSRAVTTTDPLAVIARRVRITGYVQGVGYRAWAAHVANRLGLDGWVRNRSEGSVELVEVGPSNKKIGRASCRERVCQYG